MDERYDTFTLVGEEILLSNFLRLAGARTPLDLNPSQTLAYLAPRAYPSGDALEQNVVDYYLFNKRAVAALAKNFGFRAFFYRQPILYTNQRLAGYESSLNGNAYRQYLPARPLFLGALPTYASDCTGEWSPGHIPNHWG